jgi:transcriptional regulator GlxA family with amidase domain|tara:strand:+ start:604 stop:1659 length:1056 start_codon:yes stop_codon:yes gene_type:complete
LVYGVENVISHVTLLMLDQMLLSSLAMPLEMLEAARSYYMVQKRQRVSLDVDSVVVSEPALSSSSTSVEIGNSKLARHIGLPFTGAVSLSEVTSTDLIVIPALWRNPRKMLAGSGDLLDWLRARHTKGATIMAIGTGVWLPAAAGLLSRQAATTHWHALDAFQADFPDVKLTRDHLLTQAGRIYCAASINSGADLMIHLIGLFYDAETAHYVEQQFSPEARNSFDKRVFKDDALQHPDELVALAQSWLHQHWQQPLSLSLLATKANLSERQLTRRFSLAVGESPGQYLQKLRCRYAQDLLQNTDLAIADIAQYCGCSDSSHFGRVFRKVKGVSPSQFRVQVRAKLFSVSDM